MQTTFFSNGFLVKEQLPQYKNYGGVEGGCWPLNLNDQRLSQDKCIFFSDFINNNVEQSWKNPEYVDVASDLDFVMQYSTACEQNYIQPIILFCETTKQYPQWIPNDIIMKSFKFIGFDYAFSGGSYYSAVYSDVFTKRLKEFYDFNLNEFGLFSNIVELRKFITLRTSLALTLGNKLEQGDFIIYKLWELSKI